MSAGLARSRGDMSGPAARRAVPIQSLDRGLRMLEDLVLSDRPLRLRDFVARYGVDRASAFRFLATLEAFGVAAKDPVAKIYGPGPKLLAWLAAASREMRLAELVRPQLIELARASGESGHVAVLSSEQALLVDYVPAQALVSVRNRVGVHEPLYCTAVGKAILAFLPEPQREGLIERLELVRYTPRTVPSRDALRRELTRVRRLGVAVDNAEYNELLMCVAAPLLGRKRQVLGSIGISMVRPLVRRTPGRLRRLIPLVQACGRRASAILAGERSPDSMDAPASPTA